MHCSNCNKTIPDGSAHCPYCYSAQNKILPDDVPPEEIIRKRYENSDSANITPYFVVAPAFLVIFLDIFLLVWWNNNKDSHSIAAPSLGQALISWSTLSVILIILTGINLVFWLMMRSFSKHLYVEPVYAAYYVLSIAVAVGSSFLPNLLNIIILPAFMIIVTSYTVVQLRAITKNIDEASISAALPCMGVWAMAILLIVSWFSTDSKFDGWSWIIGICMAVHIVGFLILCFSWDKAKQFAKKNGINVKSESNSQKETAPVLKNVCRKCGKDIPEESEFCPKCGTEVINLEIPKALVCSKCSRTVPDGSDFCLKCGTKIIKPEKIKSIICPNCNMEIPADSEFCPKCGSKLSDLLANEEIKRQNDETEKALAKEHRKNENKKRQAFLDDYDKSFRAIMIPSYLLVGIAALIRFILFNVPV